MANCFSAGVLMVGWICCVTITMRLSGACRRASTAAVRPAMPLPIMTISALSRYGLTAFCCCAGTMALFCGLVIASPPPNRPGTVFPIISLLFHQLPGVGTTFTAYAIYRLLPVGQDITFARDRKR